VQRKKDKRPHRKLRNAEYRAFSTAAIRVMITSSFSVGASEIATALKIDRATVYRVLGEYVHAPNQDPPEILSGPE
jgi:DNA invertase Pin-like site-specific DNA recombinase